PGRDLPADAQRAHAETVHDGARRLAPRDEHAAHARVDRAARDRAQGSLDEVRGALDPELGLDAGDDVRAARGRDDRRGVAVLGEEGESSPDGVLPRGERADVDLEARLALPETVELTTGRDRGAAREHDGRAL